MSSLKSAITAASIIHQLTNTTAISPTDIWKPWTISNSGKGQRLRWAIIMISTRQNICWVY
jgi:hypothetical protein